MWKEIFNQFKNILELEYMNGQVIILVLVRLSFFFFYWVWTLIWTSYYFSKHNLSCVHGSMQVTDKSYYLTLLFYFSVSAQICWLKFSFLQPIPSIKHGVTAPVKYSWINSVTLVVCLWCLTCYNTDCLLTTLSISTISVWRGIQTGWASILSGPFCNILTVPTPIQILAFIHNTHTSWGDWKPGPNIVISHWAPLQQHSAVQLHLTFVSLPCF